MNRNRLPSSVAFIVLAVILGKTTAEPCYCAVSVIGLSTYGPVSSSTRFCPSGDCTPDCDSASFVGASFSGKPACVRINTTFARILID